MYNNRARFPDHAQHFARWAAESAAVRAAGNADLDIAYGAGARETLDVFAPHQRNAPVLVFIHGGYWRALDKSDHSFVAQAFTRAGACVVIPNYGLCPAVSVAQIGVQLVRALAWTWRHIARYGGDPCRIVVAGHSAGGHLASLLLACDWPAFDAALPRRLVPRALSISGLYDLEPIMRTPHLQGTLGLTPDVVQRASPARLPAPRDTILYALVGGLESAEFLRQNALIRQAWGRRTVAVCEVLPEQDHFTVVGALTEPAHRLHRLARGLLLA